VLIENYTEGESPDMTVTLTTCTTFNTGPQVINSHSVLKHLTLPLGRNNGMARFANKSNSNFPSKNVWFRKVKNVWFRKGKQLLPLTTFSCDQGSTGWTNTLKTPGRQLTAAKPTGMPLMTSWPKDGYYTQRRDIGPVVPTV
jgi:hypothetical protein